MIEATFGDRARRLMALDRIPQRHAAVPSRVIEGSAVVIQTRKAEVSTLDEIGTRVWSPYSRRLRSMTFRSVANTPRSFLSQS